MIDSDALRDGDLLQLSLPFGLLYLDTWVLPLSPEPTSLGSPLLDDLLHVVDAHDRITCARVKVMRDHVLSLLLVAELIRGRLGLSEGATALGLLASAGCTLPLPWWSLVGHDLDLDDGGWREGIEDDRRGGVVARVEGWRLSDALAGVSTGGSDPFDDVDFLHAVVGRPYVVAHADASTVWQSFGHDGPRAEFSLHEDVRRTAEDRRSFHREVGDFIDRLLSAIPEVLDSYGPPVRVRRTDASISLPHFGP